LHNIETILEGCKKNDRTAQSQLYQLLAPRMLAVSLRYMQNRDEAEDVMQDAFVKIFTHLSSFRNDGSFEGWARRITANTALSALRKRNRIVFERNLVIVEQIDFAEDETATITVADILSCMDLLPAGYRTIINLFLMEEFSHREIAEKLGIQESTSRSQYTRARQMLLKLLKEKTPSHNIKNA
jgi:RNA polymerase sigma factor (sigma-70 family)